jgi:hypothetical protein
MPEYSLSDEQWCVLDLLMRARQKGVSRLNRMEVLQNSVLPQAVSIRLTWAALTMPKELLTWVGQHDFAITDSGVSLFNLRFGGKGGQPATPTVVADNVICLPGPERYQS